MNLVEFAPSESGIKPLYTLNTTPVERNVWLELHDGFEYYVDVSGFKKDELSVCYDNKTRSLSVNGLKYVQDGDTTLVKNLNHVVKIPDESSQASIGSATYENNLLRLYVAKDLFVQKMITII